MVKKAYKRLKTEVMILPIDGAEVFTRVGRDFSKWWDQLVSLGLRITLGKVTLSQNFRPLGCVTADRGALIVFAKPYIGLHEA